MCSIFPKDNLKNTRFSINFFMSIGLGGLTDNLLEYLKNMPRLIMQEQKPVLDSVEKFCSFGSSDSNSNALSRDQIHQKVKAKRGAWKEEKNN